MANATTKRNKRRQIAHAVVAWTMAFVMLFYGVPTQAIAQGVNPSGSSAAQAQAQDQAGDQAAKQAEAQKAQDSANAKAGAQSSASAGEAKATDATEAKQDEAPGAENVSRGGVLGNEVTPAQEASPAEGANAEAAPAEDAAAPSKDASAGKASAKDYPAFDQTQTVDTVKVSLQAEAGVYPAGATLQVKKADAAAQAKADKAVDKARDASREVAKATAYIINVVDEDGEALELASGQKAKLTFESDDVADEDLTAEVYVVTDEKTPKTEKLKVKAEGKKATAEAEELGLVDVVFTQEAQEEEAQPAMPAFEQSQEVDGVVVSVQADEGTFPEGSTLQVKKVSEAVEAKVSEAVDEVRDTTREVAASYTFDIKVLDANGEEVQPADGDHVHVSFKTQEVTEELCQTEVYHVEDVANPEPEALEVVEQGDVAIAEADGFSTYTVIFSYEGQTINLTDISDGNSVTLDKLMEKINLHGKVYNVTTSDDSMLFISGPLPGERNASEWTLTALSEIPDSNAVTITISLYNRPDYRVTVSNTGAATNHEIKLLHMDGHEVTASNPMRDSEQIEVYVTGYTKNQQAELQYTYYVTSDDTSDTTLKDRLWATDKPGVVDTNKNAVYTSSGSTTSGKGCKWFDVRGVTATNIKLIIYAGNSSAASQLNAGNYSAKLGTMAFNSKNSPQYQDENTTYKELTIAKASLKESINDAVRTIPPIVLRLNSDNTQAELTAIAQSAGIIHLKGCAASNGPAQFVTPDSLPNFITGESKTLEDKSKQYWVTGVSKGHDTVSFTMNANACAWHKGQSELFPFEIYVLDDPTAEITKNRIELDNLNAEWCTYKLLDITDGLSEEDRDTRDITVNGDNTTAKIEGLKVGHKYKIVESVNINFIDDSLKEMKVEVVKDGSKVDEFTVEEAFHTHDFSYSLSDDGKSIVAVCQSAGCDITEGLELTISAPANLVYTGSSKQAQLNSGIYNIIAFSGTYEIAYYDINEAGESIARETPPTDAGTYIAAITAGGQTASVSFTISPAAANQSLLNGVTPPTAATDLVYDGSNQKLIDSATPQFPNDYDTVKYRLQPDGDWVDASQITEKDVQAGGYTIEYKYVDSSGNHEDLTPASGNTITATIAPKEVTITADQANFSKIYGEDDPEMKVTLTAEDNEIVADDSVIATLSRTADEDVSDSGYTYTGATSSNPNYTVTVAGDARFTINAKNISAESITAEGIETSHTYNGNVQNPKPTKVEVDGKVLTEGIDYVVTYKDESGDSVADPTGVGKYKAVITLKGNYSGTKEIPFSIAPASLEGATVAPTSFTETWDGKAKKTVLTSVTTASDLDVPSESYTVTYYKADDFGNATDKQVAEPTDAGNYVVRIVAKADSNFTGSVDVPLTINKATADSDGIENAKPTTPNPAPTYNGSEQPLATAPNAEDVPDGYTIKYRYKYEDGGFSEWSEELPVGTNAGTYTIEYMFAGDSNHEDVTPSGNSFTTTIAKADIAPVPEAAIEGWTYGETPNSPSVTQNPESAGVTYEYFKKDDDDTYTSIGATAPTQQGDYAVMATIAESANYKGVTTAYKDFSIAAVQIDASNITVAFDQDEITYDGKDHKPAVTVRVPDPNDPSTTVNLTEGTDFTVSWPENTKDVGTKTPTITLTGNYSGTKNDASYSVVKASLSNADVTLNPESVSYTGEGKSTTPTVGIGELEVPADSYTVTYKDANGAVVAEPINAGDYTVVITAKDESNFKDGQTVETRFTIQPAASTVTDDNTTVPTAIEGLEYTGEPQDLINAGNAAKNGNSVGTMKYYVSTTLLEEGDVPANDDWSTDVPEGVGSAEETTYYVYYLVFGDDNHENGKLGGPIAVTVKAHADKLTYHANFGDDATTEDSANTPTELKVKSADTFTRDGYTFAGWNTTADGTGTAYNPEGTFTLTMGEDELYAQWTENTNITITYIINHDIEDAQHDAVGQIKPIGADAWASNGKVEEVVARAATGKAVGVQVQAHAGYHFAGWILVHDPQRKELDKSPAAGSTAVNFIPDGPYHHGVVYEAYFVEDDPFNIVYTVGDSSMGSIDVASENVHLALGVSASAGDEGAYMVEREDPYTGDKTVEYYKNASGTTATAAEGYYFDKWVASDADVVIPEPGNAHLDPVQVDHAYVKTSYTATFKSNADLTKAFTGDGAENAASPVNPTYDGQAHKPEVSIKDGDTAVSGQVKYYDESGAEVGEPTNAGTYTIKFVPSDTTGKYTAIDCGTFTIETCSVTVTPESPSVPYDGKAHDLSVDNLTLANQVSGHMLTGLGYELEGGAQIAAGTYNGKVSGSAKILDADGNDVSSNYSIEVKEAGALTIEAIGPNDPSGKVDADDNAIPAVTVSTPDGFAYTGSAPAVTLTDNVANPESTIDPSSYSIAYYAPEDINDDGTVKEGASALTDQEAADAGTHVAVITFTDGNYKGGSTVHTYTVKQASITVTTPSASKVYDGRPLTTENGTITGLVDGESATAKVTGTITDVPASAVANNNTYELVWGDGTKASNYKDETQATALGTITITKRSVALKSANFEREYNGTDLTNADSKWYKNFNSETEIPAGATEVVGSFNFVAGQGADVSFTGSQKLVGSSANAFTYTLKDNTSAGNYDITTATGTLTVTNRNAKYVVSITPASAETTYDGKPHDATGVDSMSNGETGDAAKEYEFTQAKAEDGSYTYTVTIDGVTYTITGIKTTDPTATAQGTVYNTLEGTAVVKDAAGNDVTDQFAVSASGQGALTINKVSAEDTASKIDLSVPDADSDGKFVYDGTEHAPVVKDTTTDPAGTLTRDTDYTVAYYAVDDEGNPTSTEVSPTDAGKKAVVITFTGSSNFSGSITQVVEIAKRPVTLKSDDASKVYDGTALTANERGNVKDVSEGEGAGFVSGQGFVYSITGTQTQQGSSDNVFTVTGAQPGTSMDNYETPTLQFGKLTVTKAKVADDGNGGGVLVDPVTGDPVKDDEGNPVKVVSTKGNDGDAAPLYDAADHEPEIFDETVKDSEGNPKQLKEGTDYDITYYFADEDGKPDTSKPTTADAAGNKVAVVTLKGDYEGTINVPVDVAYRSVTFTGQSGTKTYNGAEQKITDVTIDGDKLVEGHEHNVVYEVKGTEASSTPYSGEITPDDQVVIKDATGNEVTKNYDITTTAGQLTITKAAVKDNGNNTGVLVDKDGNHIKTDGSAVAEGEDPVVVVTVAAPKDEDGNDPVYDGAERKPVVTDNLTGETIPESDYTVKYYVADENGNPTAEETTASAAGDKVAVITFNDDSNYSGTMSVPTSVKKATTKASDLDADKNLPKPADNLTYNGDDQNLVAAPTEMPAGFTKVMYRTDDGEWTEEIPTGINAKDGYKVDVKYVGDANHEDLVIDGFATVKIAPKDLSSEDIAVDVKPASLVFNNAEQSPAVTVKDGTTVLALGESADYTIEGNTGKDVKEYTVTVTGHGNYTGTVIAKWSIADQKVDGKDISISFGNDEGDTFTYNGADQRPAADKVVVKVGDTTLVQGKDYVLEYPKDGSINAGSYAVKVKLINNYSGEAEKGYKIEPKPLEDSDVALSADEFIYSGSAQGPTVTVKDGSTVLVENESYTLADEAKTAQGEYTLTVTGTGNYTGNVTKDYTIKPYAVGSEDKLVVTFVDETGKEISGDFVYNGQAQKPAGVKVTLVKEDGTEVPLRADDFDATIPDDSTNAGGYNVEVTLKGGYEGTTNKGYKIKPKPLTADDVKASYDKTDFTYTTGEDGAAVAQGPKATVTDGTTALAEGASYTVTNGTATDAGTYTVTLTGTGNYTGTVTQEYVINKRAAQEPLPGDDDPTVADQTDTSITVAPTKPGFEYVVTTSETAPTDDDWSKADNNGYYKENGETENADGHTFTGLEPGTNYYVHVRKAATPNEEPSDSKTSPAPTEPTPPNADDVADAVSVDYDDEKLTTKTESAPGYQIKDPKTGEWVTEIQPFTPGQEYEVRVAPVTDDEGNEVIPPSEPSTTKYKAPERPEAPAEPTVAPNDDTSVVVSNSDADQEYIVLPVKKDSEGNPVAYTDDEIREYFEKANPANSGNGGDLVIGKTADGKELQPGTDYVVYNRTKAVTDGDEPKLASKPAGPVDVTTKAATAPLSEDEKKAVEDGTWSKGTANPENIVVNGQDGYEYLVVPKGTPAEDLDWSKADKCPAPEGAADGFKDGKKTYTKDSNGEAIDSNKDYDVVVRKSETGTSMPSEPVTVPAYTTQKPPADGEGHKDDVRAETITVEKGYEIIATSPTGTEPTSWKQGEATIPRTPGATYQIRKIEETDADGNVTKHESTPTSFSVPDRPAAPSPADSAVDVNYGDETITAKDEPAPGYEIQDPATGEWTRGPIPVEPGKTYPVRVKADEENGIPASDPVDYTAPSRDDAPEAVNADDVEKAPTSLTVPTEQGQEYIVLPPKADGTPYTEDELQKAFEEAEKNGTAKDGTSNPETFYKDGTGKDLTPNTDYQVYNRAKAVEPEKDEDGNVTNEPAVASKVAGPADVYTTQEPPATGEGYDVDYADETITAKSEPKPGYEIFDPNADDGKGAWVKKVEPFEPGPTYQVRKAAGEDENGNPVHESTPTDVKVADRPETPDPVADDAASATDSKVTVSPTDATQEYMVLPVKKDDEGNPVAYTDDEIADLFKNAGDNAKTGNGGKLDFGKDANDDPIEPGTEYIVVNRTKAVPAEKDADGNVKTDENGNPTGAPASKPSQSNPVKTQYSTPDEPQVVAGTDKITVSPADPAQEYSIDGGKTWVQPTKGEDGTYVATFDKDADGKPIQPGKDYEIVARAAASDTGAASNPTEPVKVTTQKEAEDIADDPTGNPTSVTVDPTVAGQEYIIVPKGTTPTDKDWEKSKTSKNDEAITFDASDGVVQGADYEVYTRVPGNETQEPSEATSTPVSTPRGASSDVVGGDNAGDGIAPLTDDKGNIVAKDGKPITDNGDGTYTDAAGNKLAKNDDGQLVDASGKPVDLMPAVTVVGSNPDADDAVKGAVGNEDTDERYKVVAPVYDARGDGKAPTVYSNDASGKSKPLSEGTDFTVKYYEANADGTPNYSKPLDPDPSKADADDYAFDAGEKVAVIEFQGGYAGTLTAPIKIAKREFHVITPSATKTYDGTQLAATEPHVWVEGGAIQPDSDQAVPAGKGLVANQEVDVDVIGTQTNPGSSQNNYTIRFKGEKEGTQSAATQSTSISSAASILGTQTAWADDNDGLTDGEPTAKRKNYTEIAEIGTLTVQAANMAGDTGSKDSGKRVEITPITSGDNATAGPDAEGGSTTTYTGRPIAGPELFDTKVKDDKGNPKKLVEGTDYDVAYYAASDIDPATGLPKPGAKPLAGAPADAGDYYMVVTYKGNYEGTYSTTVSIAQAELTVKTPSAAKDYDGKALTATTGDELQLVGLVNDETATLVATGSQTEVGESTNTYAIKWGTAKEANYKVVKEDLGKLTVKSAAKKASDTKTTSKKSTAKTGDETPLTGVLATMMATMMAIVVSGWRRRREDVRMRK